MRNIDDCYKQINYYFFFLITEIIIFEYNIQSISQLIRHSSCSRSPCDLPNRRLDLQIDIKVQVQVDA